MNNRKKIAEMWKIIGNNEDSYFEYQVDGKWCKATYCPNLNSDLDFWRVVEPPIEWTPKKYEWVINYNGSVYKDSNSLVNNAMTRKNKIHAERLLKKLKAISRISSWADENNHAIEFKKDSHNWYIFKSDNKWFTNGAKKYFCPDRIYMTKDGAEKLADMLNSGKFTL